MNSSRLPTLHESVAQIQSRKISQRELWQACASRIERLNPVLNAFITLMEPSPELESAHLPGSIGSRASLAGTPIAVKDLFDTAGVRTTAGSEFFRDQIPEDDAAAVARLRVFGAQIIGKTNTHEFALGVTTVNPHYGPCRNPWDTNRISGGSSGGSAVAVATGMAIAALGTDTGGSIRIPASLCGVVGLKPTHGRVSLRGVVPLSWNLDHAGPLATCVADAAILLQVLAGYDEDDPHCSNRPVDDYSTHLEDGVSGWRVAQASGHYIEDCDPEILDAVDQAASVFARIGAHVTKIDLAHLRDAALANGLMTQSDAASYHRQRLQEHPEMFGDDVRRRLEAGRDTPVVDYVRARETQSRLQREFTTFFKDFDLILLPTTPTTAPLIQGDDAVEHARRLTRFTAPFNLTGLPAISLPCGFNRMAMPMGLQLVSPIWTEALLLQAARAYEREFDWGARIPHRVQSTE